MVSRVYGIFLVICPRPSTSSITASLKRDKVAGSRSPPYALLKTFPAAPESLVLGTSNTITGCSECLPQEEDVPAFSGSSCRRYRRWSNDLAQWPGDPRWQRDEFYIVVAGTGRYRMEDRATTVVPNDLGARCRAQRRRFFRCVFKGHIRWR
jgi:hypothetical protein